MQLKSLRQAMQVYANGKAVPVESDAGHSE
jgi:hypothetical protein